MSSKKEIEKKLEEYRNSKKRDNNLTSDYSSTSLLDKLWKKQSDNQIASLGFQSNGLSNIIELQQDPLSSNNFFQQQRAGHDAVDSVHPIDHKLWLIICFSKFLLWVVLYLLCLEMELGAIFFIISTLFFIFNNLGFRRKGEKSAYSVFNKNCEKIHGTLTPEQLIYNF